MRLTGCLLLCVLLLGGCSTTPPPAPMPRTGDPVIDGKADVARSKPRDRVLLQYRTALVAMRRGQYPDARELLDDALITLGGLPAKDKGAKQARSYFHEESKKNFRGEPYERVMAYYYRGILYWMDGEPDNARACFRSAQLQDSDTEKQEYASDYVLLDYLDAFITTKLAGDGSDALKRATNSVRMAMPPPIDPAANVMVFTEYSKGPTKYASGQYGEQLRIREGSTPYRGARLRIGQKVIPMHPYDDLTYQATTRGGRVMDHVLGNKAVFKSATQGLGAVALVGGAVMASNHSTQEAGLGLAAAGLLSMIVSAATNPAADTRCWEGLPNFLSFAAFRLPEGEHTVTLEFLYDPTSPMASLSKTLSVKITKGQPDTVIFVSDKNQ